MKQSYKILKPALLALLLTISFQLNAQWQEQTSPTTVQLYSVSIVDNSVAWIGGQSGTVLKTTDGGTTWTSVGGAAIGNNVYNIFGIDAMTALCSATNISPFGGAYVFKTTDGGSSWALVYTKTGGSIDAIWMHNSNEGFMYGSPVNSEWELFNTTDGGDSWAQAPILNENGTEFGYHNAMFISGNDIYFGTTNSTIYHSNDLGNSWTSQTITQSSSYSIWFNSPSTGLMGGETSLNRTTDGGSNWNLLSTLPGTGTIDAITGTNSQWWAIRQTKIYNSNNNGDSWTSQYTSPTSGVFNAMSKSRDGELIIAVREDGGISTYNITVPVELTSFTAKYNNSGSVILNWQTATETNNKEFVVERKMNSDDYWNESGSVAGNGTTTETHLYSYVDKNVSGGKYSYRLKQVDFDGSYEYSKIVEVEVTTPVDFSLKQNYPNPFNPSTIINYTTPVAGRVILKVYNALGSEVLILVNEEQEAGNYNVEFNASGLSSGIYFYRLQSGTNISIKKMILLR